MKLVEYLGVYNFKIDDIRLQSYGQIIIKYSYTQTGLSVIWYFIVTRKYFLNWSLAMIAF